MNTTSKFGLRKISLAAALVLSIVGCQSASGGSNNSVQQVQQPASIGGAFSNYHATYNQINGTFVTIDKVFVRTDDGRRLRVRFKKDADPAVAPSLQPVVFDLRQLVGVNSSSFSQGLVFSLKDLNLPASVTSLDIVEIETHLRGGIHNEVTFSDNTDCKLKARRDLVFFTRQVFTVPVGADYMTHVRFDSLRSVQLACRGKGETHLEGLLNIEGLEHSKHHRCGKGDDDDDGDGTCKIACTLASQREEITNIINVNDEF